MVIVGCTTVTDGRARVDAAEAPVYRASVSASIEASEESSAARESERQASLTTQAVRTSCEGLSSSSVDAVNAVNAYVDAFNQGGDVGTTARPAIDALNRSADLVARSISDPLSPDLRDALTAWVDAAREVAGAIATDAPPEEFNATITKLNDVKATALNLCDSAYR
ncbi:hypothetical protein [Mycobacterium hubeiense]|uniref:hypothetical protein n=1 Tax=Mycobacterium hubeiense TaxID=1867256 RepID=UPI003D66F021